MNIEAKAAALVDQGGQAVALVPAGTEALHMMQLSVNGWRVYVAPSLPAGSIVYLPAARVRPDLGEAS